MARQMIPEAMAKRHARELVRTRMSVVELTVAMHHEPPPGLKMGVWIDANVATMGAVPRPSEAASSWPMRAEPVSARRMRVMNSANSGATQRPCPTSSTARVSCLLLIGTVCPPSPSTRSRDSSSGPSSASLLKSGYVSTRSATTMGLPRPPRGSMRAAKSRNQPSSRGSACVATSSPGGRVSASRAMSVMGASNLGSGV
jgi:hypothetical protein